MHQDRYGHIWLGTRNGLNRYDGYGFETFYKDLSGTEQLLNCNILCLAEDAHRNLWIGTRNGLNRLNLTDYSSRRYTSGDHNATFKDDYVHALCCDANGRIWIGTRGGFCYYDPPTDGFIYVNPDDIFSQNYVYAITPHPDDPELLYLGTQKMGMVELNTTTFSYRVWGYSRSNPTSIRSNNVRQIFFDSRGNLWAGTRSDGVSMLAKGEQHFVHFNTKNGLANDEIRCFAESPEGIIYVGTYHGVSEIDMRTGEIIRRDVGRKDMGHISHLSVYSMMIDNGGTFWVGTNTRGVSYYNSHANRIRYHSPSGQHITLNGIFGQMVEHKGLIYIATEGNGLMAFDPKTENFTSYYFSRQNDLEIGRDVVKSLILRGDEILCGTNYGTIYRFDTHRKRFATAYEMHANSKQNEIIGDTQGGLLIACAGSFGLARITPTGEIHRIFQANDQKNYSFPSMYSIMELEPDVFLLGSRNDGLFLFHRRKNKLVNYTEYPQINKIFRDSKGAIWLGTHGGGLVRFDPERDTFTQFTDERDNTGGNVYTILETNGNILWLSTSRGISRFDPSTGAFKHFTLAPDIPINEFTSRGGIVSTDGRVYFSGDNGLIVFDPQRMDDNPFIPPVMLGGILVNNQRIVPHGDDGILKRTVYEQGNIVLRHNQSNIAFEYSALNYISPQNNQYAYKLEGFDRDWNYVGNRRTAYYTNLPAGEYTFQVRGSNNDGLWNEQGASLKITILQPFWKTTWAYLIYTLIIGSLLGFIIHYWLEKKKLQEAILFEKLKAQAQEEFSVERNKLFTNFSHELRSPLTLIIAPLERILNSNDFSAENRSHLLMMYDNSKRLLRIANNLLDFTKHEHGKLQLRVTEGDIVEFAREMHLLFHELAECRDIEFLFECDAASRPMWFDRSLMEKVFFNLLSNAFKNTPDNGRIELRITVKDDPAYKSPDSGLPAGTEQILVVEVEDSGMGIPVSEHKKIFVPFHQISQNEHATSGTGIGLSLTKLIVEMHHGAIEADETKTNGALFRFILPIGMAWFSAEQIISNNADPYFQEQSQEEIPPKTDCETAASPRQYTIMVVEDNADMRRYIVSCLALTYRVITAANGEEGLTQALIALPDLIVSDLMMVGMDGLEMCRRLKENERTSHIPIIMITARASVHDIETGFETGVDDYVTKPFNATVLQSRIRNLLAGREKLKQVYGKDFAVSTLGIQTQSGEDERFMQRLYEIMDANLTKIDLNLYDYDTDIGMSRASLYRRIKLLTGLAPSELVRNFRLEMAAKLLRESNLPISEISVMVGFSSLSHFSTSFKAVYGISPSGYQQQAG